MLATAQVIQMALGQQPGASRSPLRDNRSRMIVERRRTIGRSEREILHCMFLLIDFSCAGPVQLVRWSRRLASGTNSDSTSKRKLPQSAFAQDQIVITTLTPRGSVNWKRSTCTIESDHVIKSPSISGSSFYEGWSELNSEVVTDVLRPTYPKNPADPCLSLGFES
jgi:hypothetical protein